MHVHALCMRCACACVSVCAYNLGRMKPVFEFTLLREELPEVGPLNSLLPGEYVGTVCRRGPPDLEESSAPLGDDPSQPHFVLAAQHAYHLQTQRE